MPKKTRKQKIAADKRSHNIWIAPRSTENSLPQENIKIAKLKATTTESKLSSSVNSNSLFTKDLYKSIFISAAILLLEIGIYVAQSNGLSITKLLSF